MPTETTPVAICLTIAVRPKEGLIAIPNLSEHLSTKFAGERKVVSKIPYQLNCAAYAHSC